MTDLEKITMSDLLPERLRAHAFNGMQELEMFSPHAKVMEEAAAEIERLNAENLQIRDLVCCEECGENLGISDHHGWAAGADHSPGVVCPDCQGGMRNDVSR